MAPGAIIPDLALPQNTSEVQAVPTNTAHEARFSLKKKTIAITGAGRGLGITLAAAVLEAGGDVACLDILEEPAQAEWKALKGTAKKSGLTATYHKVDITNEAQLEAVLNEIDRVASQIAAPFSGAIACAGVQQSLPAVDYPAVDFERIMRVNVTGTFLTAKHSARIMIKNKVPGSIVMIASMSGQIANRVSTLFES